VSAVLEKFDVPLVAIGAKFREVPREPEVVHTDQCLRPRRKLGSDVGKIGSQFRSHPIKTWVSGEPGNRGHHGRAAIGRYQDLIVGPHAAQFKRFPERISPAWEKGAGLLG
jgi:hypothetical protein